jgi:hypothetical protein
MSMGPEPNPMTEDQGVEVISLLGRIKDDLREIHFELLNIKAQVARIEGQMEKESRGVDPIPPLH